MAKQHRYPPEFGHRVLELIRSGQSVNSVAKKFEVSRQTIMKWMRQDDLDGGRRTDGLISNERSEYAKLQPENKRLTIENEILQKPRPGLLGRRTSCRRNLRIHKTNGAMYSISTMYRVLDVSTSGFYAWCKRPPSSRAMADAQLGDLIETYYPRYGTQSIGSQKSALGFHPFDRSRAADRAS